MCGIAGMIAPQGIGPGVLDRMSESLSHRGPDGQGFMHYSFRSGMQFSESTGWREGAEAPIVAFAHRRLAIIDLSETNRQPMADDTATYCLVFNGEIYNYRELRTELEALGHAFRTAGDTEVLLRAIQAWGVDCFARLNGMWALALLDVARKRVLLCRDRFGIKPLYVAARNGSVYFASEIKSLLTVPDLPREPNERTVSRFLLTSLVDDTDETFYAGIRSLPAAHWLSIPLDGPEKAGTPIPFWHFPEQRFPGREQDAVERFRELFLDALRLHLRSDVPVGTCLSGGLDSSSIVCGAHRLQRDGELPNYTHHAFGYRSPDAASNEAPYMETVASATGAKLQHVEFDARRFEEALPAIVRVQDEPFGSASIVAQWFVFERAKAEGMKVMLDGQGADETLAGYHFYFATVAVGQIARGNLPGYWRLRSAYEREIGAFPMTVRSAVRLLLARWAPAAEAAVRRHRGSLQARPLNAAVTEALHRTEWLSTPAQAEAVSATSLGYRLQQDVRSLMLPALLRYEDRNSMAHSLEARVPFLDYRLVEFAASLPDQWLIRGTTTKGILRQAMTGMLPETIRTRKDKIGFKADPGLTAGYLAGNRRLLVENRTDWERRWFRPEGIEALLTRYDGSVAAEFGLWRIANTKLWARQFWG